MIWLLLFFLPLALAALAAWSLHLASDGADRIAPVYLVSTSVLGTGFSLVLAAYDGMGSENSFFMASFFSLMSLVAVMDRETAWAPDGLMFPLTVLAMPCGVILGAWDQNMAVAAAIGAASYGFFHGTWILLYRVLPEVVLPPPSDLLAFLIPLLVMGVGYGMVAFSISISVILILCKRFSVINAVFSRREVVDLVLKNEIDHDINGGQGITFLTLAFPLLMVFIAVRIVLSA